MRSRFRLLVPILAAAALAACGRDEAPRDARVAGCPARDEGSVAGLTRCEGKTVRVSAWLVIEGARARLCDLLRESHPPQCGGSAVEVTGLQGADLELERARGVSWGHVTLTGVMRDGILAARRSEPSSGSEP